MNDFLVFAELQRMRVSRLPAMTAASMPDEPIRWTKPATESRARRQKRHDRDKARRKQLQHEAQLAYAQERLRGN